MTLSAPVRLAARALLAAAALAGCSAQPPERAAKKSALFPAVADAAFHPIRCAGPDAGDVALDPVTGNVDRDMIGDATYPAFYRAADATDVFFRMRLDGKPTKQNGALQPSSYDVLVDTDGNLETYEYMLTADGNLGSGGRVLWVRNSIQTPGDPTDAANDQAGDVLADLLPASDYYDAKQAPDGSNFNGNPDWFITLRLPKTLLAAAGIDLARAFVVWGGTNARNYSLNADFGCFTSMPATLSQAASLPVNLDPDGAPTAADDAATTAEDTAVAVAVLANDGGLRDTPIAVTVSAQPVHGAAAVAANVVTYTPAANWSGTDSFAYAVSDAQGQSSTAAVTVTVTPVNDGPPAAVADALTTVEAVAASVDVLANDTVVDAPGTVAVTGAPAHGGTTVSGGTVTYTPAPGYTGADAFTYRVTDLDGESATAVVTITVTPAAANRPPTAVADALAAAEDLFATLNVLANDGDPDGDALAISAVTQGVNGTVSFAGGTVTYAPAPNWNGSDSFTYTASDGNGGTATATVTVTVTPVNDAPVAADDSATVAEDGSVDVTVVVNDADVDGDTVTVTSMTPAAHGTVSFVGGVATYVPAPDWNGADAFDYVISDGNGGTAVGTVTVTVAPVNDAPVAADDSATVAEDGSVDVAVLANDGDADADALAISAVTQGGHGTVTFAGGTVTYAPAPDWNGTDSFTYTASDGNGGTDGGTVMVTVTPVNDPPVAADDVAAVEEDGSVDVSVLSNDVDVDGDPLSVTAVTQPSHGAVTFTGSAVTYTPGASWSGTDFFTYTAGDGSGATSSATVTVTVTATNNAPVAVDDSAAVAEDGSVDVSVLGNDSDADGDSLSVTAVTQPPHGTVGFTAATVTYTPAPNWNGTDSFTYTASDGNGGTASATVTVTVTPVSDAPVAAADSATIAEDGSVEVSVLGNDSDVDGDILAISAVTQGVNGTVSFAGGTVTYAPAPNWNGSDSFTYTASDGNGGTATATVTVTVTPVNDAPVAADDSATVAEDGSVDVTVVVNDADVDGDALSVTAVTQGAHGTVCFAGGTVTYAPAANWNGTDSFTYTASDGGGGTATATVTVTVSPVNDAPVAAADSLEAVEDLPGAIDVLANDADLDGDLLTVDSVTQGAHGSVTVMGAVVTYVPIPDWNGNDSFTYTVSDSRGGTATATVTVTVTGTADAPVAADDSASVAEDGSVDVSVLSNDTDVDGDALSVTAVTQPGHGAASFAGGVVTYVPAADWSGSDSFSYTATDGHGGTATAIVTVTVAAANDAPAAVDDAATVAEDGSVDVNVLANDSDVDGDALSVTAVTQPAHGTVTLAGATVTYAPEADWDGNDSFEYTVGDGQGGTATAIVTVTVTGANDPPQAVDDLATIAEDGSAVVDVVANDVDPDDDPLAITSVTPAAHGTVTFAGGTVTYVPAADWHGSDAFAYTAEDGGGGSTSAVVHVTVTPVDDQAVAADDSATIAEDSAAGVNVDVLANDGLADGAAGSEPVRVTSPPANGAVTVEGDRSITYRPAADFSGTDTFTYELEDADGDVAAATVTVTVTPVNDAPVARDDALAALAFSGPASVDVLANDADVDGDPLAVASVTQGAHGVVSLVGGVVTYSPDLGYVGADSFAYTIADGRGATATATVSVTIGLDPAGTPVAAADDVSTPEDAPVTVDVLANDAGLRDGPITVAIVSQPASGTAVANADGTVTFTAAADRYGTFTITYSIVDQHGEVATATLTVTVTPVNDPPSVGADAVSVQASAAVAIDVLGNDVDADGDPLTVVSVTQGTSGGTVAIDGATVVYTPPAGFTGTDTFTYVVGDGEGGAVTGVVTVLVGDDDVNDDGIRDAYGVAGGGCSSSGGGAPAALALVFLAVLKLRWRRRAPAAPRSD